MTHRTETRTIEIGDRKIGGGNPILIQSMTNTRTEDAEATIRQILRLEEAGCELIRCTVPNEAAAAAIPDIKKSIHIPLIADIHFDYKMALMAIRNGVNKIRINPGNIGGEEPLRAVVSAAKDRNIPIRVGVNSGSLEQNLIEKYGGVTPEGLAESALDKVRLIEEQAYENIVISIKSSNVPMCVRAYELIAEKCDYPLHIGITEAGTVFSGNIKSAVGLGILLYEGLGDTLRVSLTGDPVEEIRSAKAVLKTLGLRSTGPEIISCPTCGRTKIDLISLAGKVESLAEKYDKPFKVAVMGCAVNGPGEAKEADFGVAGGDGEGLIFEKGKVLYKVSESEILPALEEQMKKWNRSE